jgi:integrase
MDMHDDAPDPSRNSASNVPASLTDRGIRALKPRAKQYQVRDTQVRWLALRVNKSSKSWIYRGRIGRATRTKIGEYPTLSLTDARAEALRWRAAIVAGHNPLRPRRVHSFDALCDEFFASQVRRKLRQGPQVERVVRRLLLPRWGPLRVDAVSRADVSDLLVSLPGPMAHLTFSHCSRLFSYAVERGLIEHSPTDRLRVSRLVGPRPIRTRVLTDAELRTLWQASLSVPVWGPLMRMILLTGARRGEAAGARWSEIGDDWVIPPERFKMGTTHLVPISPPLRALLDSLPRSCSYVFTNDGHSPVGGFSHGKRIMDKASGLTGWRVHDLRRTMRTHLSAIPGFTDQVRELCIGHSKVGLARVYNQFEYLQERRDLMNLWAERLLHLVRL